MSVIRNIFLFLSALIVSEKSEAQSDSIPPDRPDLTLSGFIDAFYCYDFNKPETGYRQYFFYNHNRHNEFNLNLGFIKLSVNHKKYRANFALQAGTYANDNYANEPGLLKNIFEANAGIALNKKNNFWLDAGIFSSHIGFESAVSIDNWTLTRSILAENSPYYLSGAKLTYIPNTKWETAVVICNGWQHIRRLPGNSLPGFGTQVKYTASEKTTVNWSTFIGTDDPDSTRRMRYFNNFYGQFQITKKLGITAGFDIGIQQNSKGSSRYNNWFSPVVISRYTINKLFSIAFRGEYYSDKNGVIIPTTTANGFKTISSSLNIDYTPASNVACRIEGRWLHSMDNIFENKDVLINNNYFVTASIAVKFIR